MSERRTLRASVESSRWKCGQPTMPDLHMCKMCETEGWANGDL